METLSLMGSAAGKDALRVTTAALWVVADAAAFLLTDSFGFAAAPPAQHAAMVNSYRYLNSDEHFDDQGIIVLLRLLQGNSCEEREKWWTEIRACRRRRQFACDATVPVHTVFTAASEYQFMEHKAVVDRVRWALRDRGLLVFDAFRAFNSSNTGLLTCSELYGGLDFLGIPFTPEHVYDLVRKVATYVDGLISYVEFRRAFQLSDEELESRVGGDAVAAAASATSTIESVPPKAIPEIAEQLSEQQQTQQVPVTEALLQNFSVKTKPVPSFSLVWNSEDTQSHQQVSVWAPTVRWRAWRGCVCSARSPPLARQAIRSLITKNRVRVCLGHYASSGLHDPLKGAAAATKKFLTIELTDMATLRFRREKALQAVLDRILPPPVRFKLVWHLARGNKSLYAWKPVAPEQFVALGMVCTTTDEPPSAASIRCVPMRWCALTTTRPTKVWDDTGGGGGKAGSIWTVNSMDMIAVVQGHDPPRDPSYELNAMTFLLEGLA